MNTYLLKAMSFLLAVIVSMVAYASIVERLDQRKSSPELSYQDMIDASIQADLDSLNLINFPDFDIAVLDYIQNASTVSSDVYVGIYMTVLIFFVIFFKYLRLSFTSGINNNTLKSVEFGFGMLAAIATTLGSMSTLYEIGGVVENASNISDAIKISFGDAIFTTLLGLSVSVLFLFTGLIFHFSIKARLRVVHRRSLQ